MSLIKLICSCRTSFSLDVESEVDNGINEIFFVLLDLVSLHIYCEYIVKPFLIFL